MNDITTPVLECRTLSKTYGSVLALVEVSMTLRAGEVRALLGKNGAGKSTLVNLISGSQQPDPGGGTIELDGEVVSWSGPAAAQAGGIAVVHQEFSVVPGLSVAENITLGRWPRSRAGLGLIDAAALTEHARRAIEKLGEPLPLTALVGNLPIAQQQLVEIAKALASEPRVLILDEPTSALNSHEVDALLGLIRRLAEQGVAIIYVSHRMKEIPIVADTMTVLRNGREVATMGARDASSAEVAAMIAGESGAVAARIQHRDQREAPVVLRISDLRIEHLLNGVDLEVHEGEVLGLAGLLGSGRTELLECVYGVRRPDSGVVEIAGRKVRRANPRRMLGSRVGFTPEDRKGAGIVPMLGVGENLMLAARGRVLPRLWINRPREAKLAAKVISELAIASSSGEQPVGELSGGNQQKAVIGRMLAANMQVLLLDEPTRGIDVHAKAQIYTLIRGLASEGIATVFVSSELEELAEVCDRVLVLRDGQIADEVIGADATTEKLLALAMKEGP